MGTGSTNFSNSLIRLVVGNGTPLQYSCLENPMDGEAWWAAVCGVTTSRTQLSDFTFTLHFHALEKVMATNSSILAWRIPRMGEPGGLLSMGLHRVRQDWSDLEVYPITPTFKLWCGKQIFSFLFFFDHSNKWYISVQFSCSVVSDSLWTHGLQQARPPCPSPTPRDYSNSLSWWCHLTISFSVMPFSSRFQSFLDQVIFTCVSYLYQGAKVLEFQLCHKPFQLIFMTDFL